MFEPVSRGVSQDVFGNQSVVASKFLDSYSVFDWGRMPDAIPLRGKFQLFMQALINLKITSTNEWEVFLRSPDALAFRKMGKATAHLNELADTFPMKSSGLGVIDQESFNAGSFAPLKLTTEMTQASESFYLLNEAYSEEKITAASVMGKTVWDFSAWKSKVGPKALPFEFDCEFLNEFPKITLHCPQKTLDTEISLSEALLVTGLPAIQLEEVILRAAWIAAFIQFQLKTVTPIQEQKVIRVRMGIKPESDTTSPFVFLGTVVEFTEIEAELKKYYASTIWGKTVMELQQQARSRGIVEWKRLCLEPAPWLDRQLKNNFGLQYQKMISGIASCLSE